MEKIVRDLEQPKKQIPIFFYEVELMKGNQTDEIEIDSDGIIIEPL